MSKDNGIYILVTPSEKDKISKEEYRVAYLDSPNNITWSLEEDPIADTIDPAKVKPHFDKSKVYTDEYDAEEAAYLIAANLNMTQPPIYHVYITTAYPEWNGNNHGQN